MRILEPRFVRPHRRPLLQIDFIGPFQTAKDERTRSADFLRELWDEPVQYEPEDYAPELFKYPAPRDLITKSIQGKVVSFRHVEREFPGVQFNSADDYDSFRESLTFFRAIRAPGELDDLYGEPYRIREHLYVLASINHPDALEFFSSEELCGMFLQEKRFANPKSPEKKEFTDLQVDRLQYLASKRDSTLDNVIQGIKIQKTGAVMAARELFDKDGLKFKGASRPYSIWPCICADGPERGTTP